MKKDIDPNVIAQGLAAALSSSTMDKKQLIKTLMAVGQQLEQNKGEDGKAATAEFIGRFKDVLGIDPKDLK